MLREMNGLFCEVPIKFSLLNECSLVLARKLISREKFAFHT